MSDLPAGIYYAPRAGEPERRANPEREETGRYGSDWQWAIGQVNTAAGGWAQERNAQGVVVREHRARYSPAPATAAVTSGPQAVGLAPLQSVWARWRAARRAL